MAKTYRRVDRKMAIRRILLARGIFIAIIALTPEVSANSYPPECEEILLASSQKLKYAYAARPGGYCDGSVSFNHSASLQLVSFTYGRVRYSSKQYDLKIRSKIDGNDSVKLMGIDIRPEGSYRLDALLTSRGLSLDLRPAIHAKNLSSEYLGLLAWHTHTGRPIYVPIVASDQVSTDRPILILRAATPVVEAAYQMCSSQSNCKPQQKWAKDIEAGSRLELEIPADFSATQAIIKITVLGPDNALEGFVLHLDALQ